MSNRICLIVDDEPAIRTFLRAILDQRQFDIVEADSATRFEDYPDDRWPSRCDCERHQYAG